jgi:ferric-dicitrate binding protein FerR (iron transport regulator)
MNRGKQHVDEDLLIRFVIGETNDKEAAIVEQWIHSSAENAARFEVLSKVWAATKDPTRVVPADVDIDSAWGNLKSRMDDYAEIEMRHGKKERSLSFYMVRIAAVFVIGILIFSIYKYQNVQLGQVQLASSDSTINDNPLPDGTLISLNQNSVIEYQKDFSDKERKVKMSGEAFFKVQPDPERPFVVEAQEAIITVLGTSFNVKALNDESAVEVMVEEGLVELANPDKSQTTKLRIGEKGIYIRETSEVKKETDLDVEALYWLNKTLLFRDTELSMVFSTLEKLYEVEIKVENKEILNCKLTAKFSNETIDHILEHISIIFELKTEKKAKTITINGNGCQ